MLRDRIEVSALAGVAAGVREPMRDVLDREGARRGVEYVEPRSTLEHDGGPNGHVHGDRHLLHILHSQNLSAGNWQAPRPRERTEPGRTTSRPSAVGAGRTPRPHLFVDFGGRLRSGGGSTRTRNRRSAARHRREQSRRSAPPGLSPPDPDQATRAYRPRRCAGRRAYAAPASWLCGRAPDRPAGR